ncbi:MAG: hypothetical protein H0W94_00790 [Actinobacteria bacterium]|nr:hypothetical protein [Actinomycetota bacterium]
MWQDFRPKEIARDLRGLGEAGVEWIRAFLLWPDFMPSRETVDRAMISRLRAFLDLVEDSGLRLQLVLLVGHMSGENWTPPWLPDPSRLYEDPELLWAQELYVGTIVEVARGAPCLDAYGLTNEIDRLAGPAPSNVVSPWADRLYRLVKGLDPSRPVLLGDGAWYVLGEDSGFSPGTPQDVIAPHLYLSDEDPERLVAGHALAVATAKALAGGREVWLEEFGAAHSVFGEEQIAEWAGRVVEEARLAGAERICWWCGLDFTTAGERPYVHHAFELSFGLLRADRSQRPVAHALRRAMDRPVPDLPEAGLLVPSHFLRRYPFVAADDRDLTTRTLRNAYAALRRLGYRVRVVLEEQVAPDTTPSPLVVPSTRKLLAPTWSALEGLPGEVLYSYLHGGSFFQGAWISGARSFFGGEPRNRYAVPEPPPARLVAGEEAWDLPAAEDPFVGTPLLIDPREAEVLGTDESGRPLWLRVGRRNLLLYPLEAVAPTPEAVAAVYRRMLRPAT